MQPKLGILAGGGALPARIIARCRQTERDFFVIAIEDQTRPETVADVPHAWVRLGAAGKVLALLHDAGVQDLVMAGAIRRPSLGALRPDARAAGIFARAGTSMVGDDGLLSAVVRELEENEGFRVVGPESLLPDSLATAGAYGTIEPDDQDRHDIRRGVAVALAIGALDVGQGAVVQRGLVLAVEAAEGTDGMLARAAGLRRQGPGGVLVKVKKPGQESRADLPTIGVATVEAAAQAGLRGIAVEAGGALVIERDRVIETAERAGLFVVGFDVAEEAHG